MRRVHMIISGDVQGVGFRAWVLRWIKGKSITGWVKNRQDGTVEIVAQGSETDLQALVDACHKGPEVAGVQDVAMEWHRAIGDFAGFEVLY